MTINLRTLNLASFQATSARASAVDSPSSEQVREACQLYRKEVTVSESAEFVQEHSFSVSPQDIIDQLRAHRHQTFAEFLEQHWPADLPEDCAASEAGTDCIELDLPQEQYCISCATYASICREWYARPEVQERISA